MGNLVIGTVFEFSENVFGGSFSRPKFLGERNIIGEVIKESYGAQRGQHTFTIKVISATGLDSDEVLGRGKIRRKGRNVYKGMVKIISQPENKELLEAEKAERAEAAKNQKYLNWISDYEIAPFDCGHKIDKIPAWWQSKNPDARKRIESI